MRIHPQLIDRRRPSSSKLASLRCALAPSPQRAGSFLMRDEPWILIVLDGAGYQVVSGASCEPGANWPDTHSNFRTVCLDPDGWLMRITCATKKKDTTDVHC